MMDRHQQARHDQKIREVWFDYEGKAVAITPHVPWPGDRSEYLFIPDGFDFIGKTKEQIEKETLIPSEPPVEPPLDGGGAYTFQGIPLG